MVRAVVTQGPNVSDCTHYLCVLLECTKVLCLAVG